MPASRSPSRDPKPAAQLRARHLADDSHRPRGSPRRGRCHPARSIITHFLPPGVAAEDFSGSLWHGSAGKIRVNARDAGALEWWLHPAALLGMTVNADLHWVKVGFVIDAAVAIDRHGFAAHDIKGGGPIEDLRDLGVAPGWRGIADVHLSELAGRLRRTARRRRRHQGVESRVGRNLPTARISAATICDFREGAADPDGNMTRAAHRHRRTFGGADRRSISPPRAAPRIV